MRRGSQTREQRLATALRENLKRRKARARALEKKESNSRVDDAGGDTKAADLQGSVKFIPCLTLRLRQSGQGD